MRLRIIFILIALVVGRCCRRRLRVRGRLEGDAEGDGADRRRLLPARLRRRAARRRRGVEVANLTPAGAEPHDLELTPGDVDEGRGRPTSSCCWATASSRSSSARRRAPGARAARSSTRPGSAAHGNDPHVWLDPLRYALIVRRDRQGARTPRPRRPARRAAAHARPRVPRAASRTAPAARSSRATRRSATSRSDTACSQVAVEGLAPGGGADAGQTSQRVVDLVRKRRRDDGLLRDARLAALADTIARETGREDAPFSTRSRG